MVRRCLIVACLVWGACGEGLHDGDLSALTVGAAGGDLVVRGGRLVVAKDTCEQPSALVLQRLGPASPSGPVGAMFRVRAPGVAFTAWPRMEITVPQDVAVAGEGLAVGYLQASTEVGKPPIWITTNPQFDPATRTVSGEAYGLTNGGVAQFALVINCSSQACPSGLRCEGAACQ